MSPIASESRARGSGFGPAKLPLHLRLGVAFVVAVYVAYSLFGIGCPYLWGHHGYHGATYMLRAIMTLRFHTIIPCSWAGYDFPPTFSWYFHHPIGYHHLLVPFVWLFGVHEWVGCGFAAAWGLLTIHALFTLVRRWWSPELALLAIALFVSLPFVVQFSVLLDAQFPAMACTLYALDCFLRYLESPTRKWLLLGALAFMGCGLLMWDGYFQAFFQGLYALALMLTSRGRKARFLVAGKPTRLNANFAWVLYTGLLSSLTMGFHFLLTWSKGRMSDFGGSYELRHNASFTFVFEHAKQWMEILFGWPVIGLGALWLAVFVFRAVIGKARQRDFAVFIFLVTKTFYTALFGEAAAMHEYRVDWYLFFFLLAAVDLASDLHQAALALLPRVFAVMNEKVKLTHGLAAAIVLSSVAVYFYLDLPHAYKNLIDSRVRMGTDAVPYYDADYSKQLFAMEAARRTGKDDFFFVHNNMPRRIEFYYYMDRSNQDIAGLGVVPKLLKTHPRALLLMDVNVAGAERNLLLDLLRHHPADIYDHYILVDLRSDKPGLHEWTWKPKPSSLLYRYFVSHRYPAMSAVEQPTMLSGCLDADAGIAPPTRTSMPLEPTPAVLANPNNWDQALCYYDLKRLSGDAAGAEAWLAKLSTQQKLSRSDVAMGTLGRMVGLTPATRTGLSLYWKVENLTALPKNATLHFRLLPEPLSDGKPGAVKPVTQGNPVKPVNAIKPGTAIVNTGSTPIVNGRPGTLRIDPLTWRALAGRYRLLVDVAVPSSAQPLATADLGIVVIP